jgi:hypothetical protein
MRVGTFALRRKGQKGQRRGLDILENEKGKMRNNIKKREKKKKGKPRADVAEENLQRRTRCGAWPMWLELHFN